MAMWRSGGATDKDGNGKRTERWPGMIRRQARSIWTGVRRSCGHARHPDGAAVDSYADFPTARWCRIRISRALRDVSVS